MDGVKSLIKQKFLSKEDPYLRCFIITNNEKDTSDQELVKQACESLKEELGFRFKIEFKPECCYIRARKIPDKGSFEMLRAVNNFARFG